ncbi:MAG: molybdopterin-dependent oxidoreductase [Gordonia amarae]
MTAEPITHSTQCTLCESHCGILVTVKDGAVARIAGNPDDVLSKGYICPKATAMGGVHEDPDRLRQPIKRVGDSFEPVSWEQAYAEIGRRLRKVRADHGNRALGLYVGNPAAHSSAVMYFGMLRAMMLTPNFFSASTIDQMPHEYSSWRTYGSNFLLPVTDIDRTDRLVILGANPAVSNSSLSIMPGATRRIKDVRARGGKVVVIDPRHTETAQLADQHVAVRPGGDIFLLLAMLNVLFNEDLVDRKWLNDNASGTMELRALVSRATPEVMGERAGVDPDLIRSLAREHAAAESAAMYARIGICQQQTGTLVSWLVTVVNAVTGNLDRPGGIMFPTPVIDIPRFTKFIPAAHGAWTDRSGRYKAFRSELPAVVMADEILTPGPGQIRAMITVAGNPVSSIPHAGRLDDAMKALDLYVAVDMYVTETTRHADFILPPVSPLEREEVAFFTTLFTVRNSLRMQRRSFQPPADAMEDWQILVRLMLELLPKPLRALFPAPVRNQLMRLGDPNRILALGMALGPYGRLRKGRNAITVKKLHEARGGIDLGPLVPRLKEVIATKDRRVALAPAEFVEATLDQLAKPIPGPDAEFDLRLLGRRQVRSNNSWLHNLPRMTSGQNRCNALLNSDDAAQRGLADGDLLLVTSKVGKIQVPLRIDDGIRPGSVVIPHGWGHQATGWQHASTLPGENVNDLHDPAQVDPFTGTAAVNDTWVKVSRAD